MSTLNFQYFSAFIVIFKDGTMNYNWPAGGMNNLFSPRGFISVIILSMHCPLATNDAGNMQMCALWETTKIPGEGLWNDVLVSLRTVTRTESGAPKRSHYCVPEIFKRFLLAHVMQNIANAVNQQPNWKYAEIYL